MTTSLVNITINKILNLIKNEKLKPNDKLPTVEDLALKFNVGRSTIREALKVLSTQNIITIKQGSGTFISEQQGMSKDPLGLEYISDDINIIIISDRFITGDTITYTNLTIFQEFLRELHEFFI